MQRGDTFSENLTLMKTFMSYAFVALFLVGFASSFSTPATFEKTVASKQTSCFDYFRAHRQAFGIALNWSAPEAVSFKIQRSYDGEFFENVTAFEAGAAASHKYVDKDIYHGTITYRIIAVKADGSTENSPLVSVLYVKRH
jgi:hypothetical protein